MYEENNFNLLWIISHLLVKTNTKILHFHQFLVDDLTKYADTFTVMSVHRPLS